MLKGTEECVFWFGMRILFLFFCAACLGLSVSAAEGGIRIAKVLPHFLDKKGHLSVSPSLFERDAYQGYLRHNPEEISTLRYDFQWRGGASTADPITVRLETRGSRSDLRHPNVFETPLVRSGWGKWAFIAIPSEEYHKLGAIMAWRLSLWQKGVQIAEQKSFLW